MASALVTEDKIKSVRTLAELGKSQRELAEMYNTTESDIELWLDRSRKPNDLAWELWLKRRDEQRAERAQLAKEIASNPELQLMLELARLDRLVQEMFNIVLHGRERNKIEAARCLITIMDRRAKYLGLDDASRVNIQASLQYVIDGVDMDRL